jgi:lipopolysaccharide biosynthesis glycosyltransferase
MISPQADPVELACCFDRSYVRPTAVMATSVLAHASPTRRYTLYLVYDGDDDAPLEAFKNFRSTSLDIRLVKVRNVFAGTRTAHPDMPPVSFLRLALADLLPGVSKVLSLDPDLICLTDVAPLFDTELGEAPLAAVADLAMANGLACEVIQGAAGRDDSKHRYFALRLGLDAPAMAAYFNAGVMLFDLERLRRDDFATRARAFVASPGEPLRWNEQCVLNAFFARRYKPLEDCWNAMLDPPGPDAYAAGGRGLVERVAAALASPAILHFNWKTKPWLPDPIPTSWSETWWSYALAAPLPWTLKLRWVLSEPPVLRRVLDASVLAGAARIRARMRSARCMPRGASPA